MTEYIFTVFTERLVGSACFTDVSAAELKVLLAIIAKAGTAVSEETLADISGTTVARTKAAIALFEELGIVEKNEVDAPLGEVIYEFEKRGDAAPSRRSIDTARDIRSCQLQDMHTECEKLLGKTLATYEIGNLTSLCADEGFSPEYVVYLTSYLVEIKSNLKVTRIVNVARDLRSQGIDTLEELEIYVERKRKEIAGEMELRHLLGIHGRALTPTEKKYFTHWLDELGYSCLIIGEAYDIAVQATDKRSLPYMNKVLEGWHAAGCRTLEECRANRELHKSEHTEKKKKTKKSAPESDVPKYADFNSEDALMRALERSYSDEKK